MNKLLNRNSQERACQQKTLDRYQKHDTIELLTERNKMLLPRSKTQSRSLEERENEEWVMPFKQPKVYTEEEIKEMRRELNRLQFDVVLRDGDPKVIMEARNRRQQRINELRTALREAARSKKEKGGLGFFEKLKEFWAFVKHQRREEKLNNLNQLYKIRMKTDKPTSKEKYQKVIDLEKALENVNRNIRWGTVHYLIDPRPDLRFRIDEARLAAGCALVYHSEKEWPEVLRQYEARKKRMKEAERLTKEWNKKFGFPDGLATPEQDKGAVKRTKTVRKTGGLRESLITSSKVPNKGGRNGL